MCKKDWNQEIKEKSRKTVSFFVEAEPLFHPGIWDRIIYRLAFTDSGAQSQDVLHWMRESCQGRHPQIERYGHEVYKFSLPIIVLPMLAAFEGGGVVVVIRYLPIKVAWNQ